MHFLWSSFKRHFSLLIVLLGAGCFFVTNLLLREQLTAEQYGIYSLLITYLSIQSILGLGGLEQVFLRYSFPVAPNEIATQAHQWRMQTLTVLGMTAVGVYFFAPYIQKLIPLSTLWLVVGTLAFILVLSIYNIFRLNGDFTLAQLVLNGWKILLPVLAYYCFYYSEVALVDFLQLILVLGIIITFVFSCWMLKRIRFIYNTEVSKTELQKSMLQFFISIFTFTLLLFGDRIVIENRLGISQLGDYFYLTNFFLAPFSILQSYIGFKQLVTYKKEFSLKLMYKFNRLVLVLGLAMSIGLWLVYEWVMYFDLISFPFSQFRFTVFLLLIMGIVRIYISSVGAAFEAQTNLQTIQKANTWFIGFALISLIFGYYQFETMNAWIGYFIGLWVLRGFLYRQLIVKQFKQTTLL